MRQRHGQAALRLVCAAFLCVNVSLRTGQHLKSGLSIARAALVLVLVVLLAACAGSLPAATVAPAPTTGVATQPVTLLLWHGWYGTQRQALSQLVERFNRQSSEGRVILQSVPLSTFAGELRSAATAGSGPHLALIPNTWIGGLAADGVLLPLDEQISQEDRNQLLPVTLAGAELRDQENKSHLYGLPVSFDTLALYYNTANLLTPPPDTISLLDSARGLGAPTATPPIWGFALNLSIDSTVGYLYAFGGRVFDQQGTLILGGNGRAGAEQWLSWLQMLNGDQQILARAENSIAIDRELKSGRVLMTFDWAHHLELYRNLWSEKLGVALLPRLSETDQPPSAYVKSDLLAINSRIGVQESRAAIAFLRFMISAEAQQVLLENGMQPARRTLALDPNSQRDAIAQVFRTQAERGLPMPNAPERQIIEQELRFMQQQVLMGFTSPTDAVTEADRRLRARLNLP